MALATRLRDATRRALGKLDRRLPGVIWTHLCQIRYRLLLVNILVVAVPIVGIGFARTFEREMLASLENDMIHQAELLRAALVTDPGGLRLAGRGALLEDAARHTRTRIRLLDATGHVVADSHGRGPPEGAEKPAPRLFGLGRDEYHAPEQPRPVDVSSRREVRTALGGRYGSATRLWENRERVYLFSALPVPDRGPVAAVIYVTRSTAPVKFAMFRLRTWLVVILVAALLVTAVLSLFLAATISRPLGRLTRIARRIAAGDRRHRLSLHRRDEIGQLARAFDTMTQRLDERARQSGDLAANISHEFKSPLTSIRGAAELLCDGAVEDVPARDRFLRNILADTHRLDRLVTRLLELSRFEADDAPLEHIDYEALIREVVEQKRASLIATRTAELAPGQEIIEPASVVIAYRSKTTQLCVRRSHIASALGNLLDNAIQHAESGSTITVHVSDDPNGSIRTAVTNRGSTISEATMARLWDRFFTTRARQGGTGLGLAIVSSIIQAHGGQTFVTSSDTDGTTFSFDLPRDRA